MNLNEQQRIFVQTIFDYFHEKGEWPTFREIDKQLIQINRRLSVVEISKSLPFGFANQFVNDTFGINLIFDQKAVLSIQAIYLCEHTKEELEDFVKAVHFAADLHFVTDGKYSVRLSILASQLQMIFSIAMMFVSGSNQISKLFFMREIIGT